MPTSLSPAPAELAAWLELIRAARIRLSEHVRETPVVTSHTIGEEAGRSVFLKLENLQRTGAFKLRGALNKLLCMDAETRARGMIAASAGNHAQGLALAASIAGSRATIVMPLTTALIKVRRTEHYGATVILHGATWDESHALACKMAEERGFVYVHPFDDAEIIAGQGTVGLELLEQLPDQTPAVLPIGRGGHAPGVAHAHKAQRPEVRVVGVQAEGAAAMVHSFERGELTSVAHPETIAEGIRVGTPGTLTFSIIKEHVDACVTVSEPEIVDAVVQTLQKSKVVAETGGVVGVAALVHGRVGGEDPACVILSGGNIDMNMLGRLIQSGLAAGGFYHRLLVRVPDQPGKLAEIVDLLAKQQTNIVEIEHRRAGWQVPVGSVDVDILLETRREGEGQQIEAALTELGFDVR